MQKLKFADGSDGKESACIAGSFPGLGRFPGEGHGNPLQYSCQENPMDRRTWRATVQAGHKESNMTKRLTLPLSTFAEDMEHVP